MNENEITYKFINPGDVEAKLLIDELSLVLQEITGDDGRSSFSEEDFNLHRDAFLIALEAGVPVACGALRCIDEQTCEIKRMYARVKGYGVKILCHLEEKAKEFGYTHVILSTRRVNTHAVKFYQNNGYLAIAPYGKYRNSELSICMGKALERRK